MKKRLLPVIFFYLTFFSIAFSFPLRSTSQQITFGKGTTTWEAGFNCGPSFFLGDLGGNEGRGERFIKDVNVEFTNIIKGAFIAVYPKNYLGFRAVVQTGYLQSADEAINTRGRLELFRKERNLDFKSALSEAYVAMEFHPWFWQNRNNEFFYGKFSPYVLAGIGICHFNPQGSVTNANGEKTWYYLKPLHTEGQGMAEYPDRKNYSLTQINVPLGGGLKYFLSERTNISLEVLHRKSFTDYIDDVSTSYIDPKLFDKYLSPADAVIARKIHDKTNGSNTPGASRIRPGEQRGNPKQNDSYFSVLLKIGFRLGNVYESEYFKSMAAKARCPARF